MSILKALGYYSENIKLKDIYHNNESENGEHVDKETRLGHL